MKKRMMSLMLSMTMVAGVLGGCGNTEDAPVANESSSASENASTTLQSNEGTDTTAAEETSLFAEPVDFTWLGYYTSNLTVANNSWAEQLIEKNFNVNITSVTDVNSENSGVYISSGEILDTTVFCSYIAGAEYTAEELYNQGVIREFPEEWLWEYYPTGMQNLTAMAGEEYFDNGYNLVDGKCVNVPYAYWPTQSNLALYYRADWLENLGIKEPTSLDELHDMLYAFTYDDPDKNGQNDTYGMSAIESWLAGGVGYYPIYGAFGFTRPTAFVANEDGSVAYNAATDNYKNALTVLKEWYDEGILDPECLTDDRAGLRAKWANGNTGATTDSAFWGWSSRGTAGLNAMVEDANGEANVTVMGPLTTTYGNGKVYGGNNGVTNTNMSLGWYFSADATDEQVIRFLQIQEGLASNQDLFIDIVYGEEGVDFNYTDEGSIQVADTINVEYQASKGIGTSFYGSAIQSREIFDLQFTEDDKALNETTASGPQVLNNGNIPANITNEARNTYYSEVEKIVTEYYSNVLLGKDDLDAGWDAYVEKLNKAGLEQIIAEYVEKLK